MLQIAKRVMFSESCSAVSFQWRCSASAGTLKSKKIRLGVAYFSHGFRPPEAHLTLNGRNIFVNHVKYLGVNFDKRIT
jgi:hypothetical protein